MQHRGGFILGANLSMALLSSSCAGFIRGVWKAPLVLMVRACRARAFVASWQSLSTAALLPAQVKPAGKRTLAIWQTVSSDFSAALASLQSFSSVGRSRPATEHMLWGTASVASCIASARIFTSLRQSSNSSTPAAQIAVYSPRLRPATACGRSTTSFLDSRMTSIAARPATNIAGWQCLVSLSLSSGPFKHSSLTSQPSTFSAVARRSLTAALFTQSFSMPTYWEP
mmetsp:Transcript_605/g.1671  ORF Transcript_605/g.1671 Transcript_605/m.1671 type:complete len:227 (+) Transcript_605:457-1137(+)